MRRHPDEGEYTLLGVFDTVFMVFDEIVRNEFWAHQ